MSVRSVCMVRPLLVTVDPSTSCTLRIQVAVVLNEELELFIAGCLEFPISIYCFQWAMSASSVSGMLSKKFVHVSIAIK